MKKSRVLELSSTLERIFCVSVILLMIFLSLGSIVWKFILDYMFMYKSIVGGTAVQIPWWNIIGVIILSILGISTVHVLEKKSIFIFNTIINICICLRIVFYWFFRKLYVRNCDLLYAIN